LNVAAHDAYLPGDFKQLKEYYNRSNTPTNALVGVLLK